MSSANSNDVSFSKNLLLTPTKGMDSEEELNFSIGFSKVLVESDKSCSPDSFSSFAGTNFNQGAEKFIALLEKHMEALKQISSDEAEDHGLLFEKIVIDMKDLGLNDALLTSTDIPGISGC